ncbi:MAG: hypothetical protein C5B59_12750 [Bacteroidetes bacterium]|nr:MAG: hypothetical protein C5B59_12750 [Bacteroidota bacterium]
MKQINYGTYQKPSDYMKFDQGDNVIRIVSVGAFVKRHGMRTAGGYIPLGDCTEKPDCKFCNEGNKAKQKWFWIAYSKTRKEVKMLDAGPQIGDAICTIARNVGKDPREFDLIVTRKGDGLKTRYSVEKGGEEPIPEAEVAGIESMKKYLVHKYIQQGEAPQGQE